ncbi:MULTISPECIES: hypothetical protein [Bacteroidota]|uniref:Uncharacterized protein n=1 Tax=Euzebyella saccharophila TaxID=679664 RepID=A0ABV8JS74_9FLAO|nr:MULTISPECIES: hypothetical protein [Bacteroidota]MBC6997438.1 hypothetical protein [Cytophaga sp. FL35]
MQIIEKYDRQFEYASILMNVVIAFQFFSLWYRPSFDDIGQLGTLTILMAFEFGMIHSGVFMAIMPKKISLFVLVPFYGTFAWGFNSYLEDNTILYIYMTVVFNRMRFAFSDVPLEMKARSIIKSVLAAVMYFFMLLFFVLGADIIPKLGLTAEFVNMSGYRESMNTSGAFIDLPHAVMAFGLTYYCGLALMEALLLKRTFAVNLSPKTT